MIRMGGIEKWASGWNSPDLPGQVFRRHSGLRRALRMKQAQQGDEGFQIVEPPTKGQRIDYIRRSIDVMPREDLLKWLEWNDPQGSYSDADAETEGMEPMEEEEARDLARQIFFDPNQMGPNELAEFADKVREYHPGWEPDWQWLSELDKDKQQAVLREFPR